MTQEDKKLLLKDLCARLPYGVICYNSNTETDFKLEDTADIDSGYPTFDYGYGNIESIRPYLRTMSSMTEEEKEYIRNKYFFEDWDSWNDLLHYHYHLINVKEIPEFMEWIYAHHFDFLNLIEKGLAFEAPEGMYNTKK